MLQHGLMDFLKSASVYLTYCALTKYKVQYYVAYIHIKKLFPFASRNDFHEEFSCVKPTGYLRHVKLLQAFEMKTAITSQNRSSPEGDSRA